MVCAPAVPVVAPPAAALVRARRRLAQVLRGAHAGERAAAFAYAGHALLLRRTPRAVEVRAIADEEWDHRRRVRAILTTLAVRPQPLREAALAIIGAVIAVSCQCIGAFLSDYFAGRLEHGNVHEYDEAADCARTLGMHAEAADLGRMARVEEEHERYFLGRCQGCRLLPVMRRLWNWG